MTLRSLAHLGDDARVWVYGLDRPLAPGERARLAAVLDAFVAGWTSHAEPVEGAWDVLEDRFLVVAARCAAGLGGCAIDDGVRAVREAAARVGVDPLRRDLVFWRTPDGWVRVDTRADFAARVAAGEVGDDTPVFDTTVSTLGDLRARFETTMARSWHARAFSRPATPPGR